VEGVDPEMGDIQLAQQVSNIMRDEKPRTETEMRQEIIRLCMLRGLVYVQLQFDPFGTPFFPSISGTPAKVAEWLRQFADDIEGIT